jgi:hypothetical protein
MRDALEQRPQEPGLRRFRAEVDDAAPCGVVAVARLLERQARDLVQQRAFFRRGNVVGLVDESRRTAVGIEKLGLRD